MKSHAMQQICHFFFKKHDSCIFMLLRNIAVGTFSSTPLFSAPLSRRSRRNEHQRPNPWDRSLLHLEVSAFPGGFFHVFFGHFFRGKQQAYRNMMGFEYIQLLIVVYCVLFSGRFDMEIRVYGKKKTSWSLGQISGQI